MPDLPSDFSAPNRCAEPSCGRDVLGLRRPWEVVPGIGAALRTTGVATFPLASRSASLRRPSPLDSLASSVRPRFLAFLRDASWEL